MGHANALTQPVAGNTAMTKGLDISPFEAPGAQDMSAAAAKSSHTLAKHDASLQKGQHHHQPHQKQQGFSLFNCCSCFGRSKGSTGLVAPECVSTAPQLPHCCSHRGSNKRPFLHSTGSIPYSEVEWFDAQSSFRSHPSDHADLLAELDQLAGQASLQQQQHGPWVPDPPLRFAGDLQLRFVPPPLHITPFCGYWARDEARSSPSPQPVDVMLGLNFITRRVHDSIPGALLSETEQEFHLLVKPTFCPPGLNRYAEVYDKASGSETSWILRRDLRPGSSTGHVYMTTDGMMITRIKWHSLMSSSVDGVMEEYYTLEDDGNTLICKQCCYHFPTGKTAVQFLVGIKQPHPPKGWL